jgi:hypothetical protein
MSSLSIYAGPTALKRISEEGLNQQQFNVLVGASGGPKWFVLYGLDRYLFGDFFANRKTELITLGTSAGAWRMCCLATADPVAAVERLAQLYSNETYSSQPDTDEITNKAIEMLNGMLGDHGVEEIVNNRIFRTNIIADRCRGFGSSRSKPIKMAALGMSAVSNLVSRRALSLYFERTFFSTMGERCPWGEANDLKTALVEMNEDNAEDAMLATGSIPFVLNGVRNIKGSKPGLYLDGGITDYHFDLPFHKGEELVLYPHFSADVIPGWFDKHIPWRRVDKDNFHNVVLVTPSAEFAASLPYGKISDRKDFEKLTSDERLTYWQAVLDRSERLAEDFSALVDSGVGLEDIKPFTERNKAGYR